MKLLPRLLIKLLSGKLAWTLASLLVAILLACGLVPDAFLEFMPREELVEHVRAILAGLASAMTLAHAAKAQGKVAQAAGGVTVVDGDIGPETVRELSNNRAKGGHPAKRR